MSHYYPTRGPLFQVVFILLFFSACKTDPAEDPRFDGNRRMAATLDSLARNADPKYNFYLSGRKAEEMKRAQPRFKNDLEKLRWNKTYYQELLNSGKTEEAAKGFAFLLTDPKYGALIEQNKIYEIEQLLAVSYLRMGEQVNCVKNHTSQSCIVPLKPEGFHTDKTGSQRAIEVYKRILAKKPDDLSSRWLMNIAYMTLGEYPQGVPKEYLVPVEAFKGPESGVQPFRDVAIETGLDVNGLAGGSVIEDFNNDGLLDVFCTSYGLYDNCRLFINHGAGGFMEHTDQAQLKGLMGGLNAKQADYDNDGFTDILILRGAWLHEGGEWPNSLLHNNGDGTFSDMTYAAGMVSFRPTETASWADVNGDGWLDVFIANENDLQNRYPNELWINQKDGTFAERSKEMGLGANYGYVKGVNVNDFNNDGRPDVYLSILGSPDNPQNGRNKLFMNRDKGGQPFFEEISKKAGIEEPLYSFPSAVFDYDNDGWLDIYVTGFDMKRLDLCGEDACREYLGLPAVAEKPRLFRNNGDETFTDVTAKMKLDKVTFGMGLNTGDIDNDGWMDIYVGTGAFDFRTLVPNRMFRNVRGEYFEELTMNGFGHLQKGHGIAFGDLDNDGDQDIYCVMGGAFEGDDAKNVLFENPGSKNHWITVNVEAKNVNRAGHGSRVRANVVDAGGKKRSIYAVIGSGATFGANSIQTELGLGAASSLESIEILWEKPGYPVTKFTGVGMDQFVLLKEEGSKVEIVTRNKFAFAKKAAGHEHHH